MIWSVGWIILFLCVKFRIKQVRFWQLGLFWDGRMEMPKNKEHLKEIWPACWCSLLFTFLTTCSTVPHIILCKIWQSSIVLHIRGSASRDCTMMRVLRFLQPLKAEFSLLMTNLVGATSLIFFFFFDHGIENVETSLWFITFNINAWITEFFTGIFETEPVLHSLTVNKSHFLRLRQRLKL